MMDAEKMWSVTELNKFIWQRVKELCEAAGFVPSPRRAKYLVRAQERYIQIVHPEIYRSRAILRFGVSPAASFRSVIFGEAKVYPRKDNNKDEFFNDYYMLAADPYSAKPLFDSGKMRSVWAGIVVPQLEEELFSVLRGFGAEQFAALCENRKSGVLRYSSEPGIDDGTLAAARGHNRIWQGRTGESVPFLEQAVSGYEKHFARCKTFEEPVLPEIREEHAAVGELLSVIKNGGEVLERMRELERTALNKAWGIARSPEGKTIRLKKKELL